MIRLEQADFEEPQLTKLAEAAGMSPDKFKTRFGYLIDCKCGITDWSPGSCQYGLSTSRRSDRRHSRRICRVCRGRPCADPGRRRVCWEWVRNWWFRVAHLVAILIVAAEAFLDIPCPLTEWEYRLRELWPGGQKRRHVHRRLTAQPDLLRRPAVGVHSCVCGISRWRSR